MGSIADKIREREDEEAEQLLNSAPFYGYRYSPDDPTVDMVNKPPHYQGAKFECIDVIEEITKDLTGIEAVCTANAIKYLYRWKKKNGLQDISKSIWYLNKLIETLKK